MGDPPYSARAALAIKPGWRAQRDSNALGAILRHPAWSRLSQFSKTFADSRRVSLPANPGLCQRVGREYGCQHCCIFKETPLCGGRGTGLEERYKASILCGGVRSVLGFRQIGNLLSVLSAPRPLIRWISVPNDGARPSDPKKFQRPARSLREGCQPLSWKINLVTLFEPRILTSCLREQLGLSDRVRPLQSTTALPPILDVTRPMSAFGARRTAPLSNPDVGSPGRDVA